MAQGKIETYAEAARVIHLWLEEFCDEKRSYPDMIAEAARRAREEIDRLRHLTSRSSRAAIATELSRCDVCHQPILDGACDCMFEPPA